MCEGGTGAVTWPRLHVFQIISYLVLISQLDLKRFPEIIVYSAANKESTFSEILISAVKFTFSHSNHHKKHQRTFG